MKIGVITSAYPEYEDDPHGIFVHRLMKEVTKKGHEVHVLAPYTGKMTNFQLDGVYVQKFNYFYPKRFQKLAGRSGMIDNVKEGVFVKFQFCSFIIFNLINSYKKLKDMDIVHVQWPIPNGLGALFLKKISKIPYINTIHGEEVYLSKKYHTVFLIKLLVNNSSKTITNSSATLKTCLNEGLDKKKLDIIPFGVDTSFYKPLNIVKDKKIFQILSVGYLIERKGFMYLISSISEVSKKHENVRLKIVGSGPQEKQLKDLITKLQLEKYIEILGNIPNDELLKMYNSSDLFVLPSIIDSQGNTEGLGVVLIEAMACGLPVIGSNIGGIPDIISDGETGLLFPQKDVVELSKSIIKLIENRILMEKIADKGYQMVKTNFSWEKIAAQYIDCYEKIKK
ncbi:glycosyl transferase group 1 [Methanobacterium lacus]|uniref:Glycosyl transferase group 1 n=1 Tax=Methanobacterium lacus (strain AL-21) TaxID=877455 RepID=F0TAU6_METLA|nr:glycosyltransferase family 4 protein [Methanobacterium lacus]ADZ08972.1 glycosyl transferase group 1 [Methanobacterium lacus]